MSLSSRLGEAEEHGIPRRAFPMDYRGHRLILLINDAHDTDDGRVLIHVALMCSQCDKYHTVRGRTPYGNATPNRIALAKLAAFGPFTSDCPG